ncbi:hypothetical protein QBC35DRAFT_226265 [Podospora australis]|uniref:Signal transduction histidine-protein kinase n=1 Tax=Podospora australis TaxID=1536484 RepID=A0AAN7ANE7_9PEZI|nr:hypothetical protein QBC35DRAFT_226265 [Podospora australis]
MHSSFTETSIIDLLEADPRPSFIIAPTVAPHPPTVVYTNPAFSGYPDLVDLVGTSKEDHGALWQWITGNPSTASAKEGRSFQYLNVYWTRTIVREDLIVVGANDHTSYPPAGTPASAAPESRPAAATRPPLPRSNSTPPLRRPLAVTTDTTKSEPTNHPPPAAASQSHSQAEYALTGLPIDLKEQPLVRSEGVQSLGNSIPDLEYVLPDLAVLEEHPFLEVIDSVDWSKTPLGPKADWPTRLEQTVTHILADSRPIAIYWGSSYTTIYNEAFSKLCGPKHPAVLGLPVQDLWNEAGQKIKETMSNIAAGKRGSAEGEWEFFVERESDVEGGPSWLEETFLKWSVVPIIDNGTCLGFTHAVVETTSMRVWERRVNMLINLGENLVMARDVESYWETTIQQLAAVEPSYDVPLAVLYSVDEDTKADPTAREAQAGPAKVCRLAGTLGVPENHPIAPATLNLRTGHEPLAYLFRDALESAHPLLIQTSDGTLPEAILEGLERRSEPCRAAIIIPIRPTKKEKVAGILLLGLNPRLPYDNSYQQFIFLLNQKLTTSLASILLLEEEAKRSQHVADKAAHDQAMLKEKLAEQTKEANESIQLFEAVAEFVPVGMCVGDERGNITFANDAWYKITGYPSNEPLATKVFLACINEEDRHCVKTVYERLKTVNNVEFEFRVKRNDLESPLTQSSPSFEKTALHLPSIENVKERYIVATARAERAADGSTVRVLTCLADVTAHKRAAEEAGRRATQAENLKRMAEFATVGLYDMDLEGRLAGANNVFFKMCGLQNVDLSKVVIKPFEDCVCEEDRSVLTKTIQAMLVENKEQMAEVRLTTALTPEGDASPGVVIPRWVQATLMPVRTVEGVVQSFTGCLSDVSLQKWQFEREKERREQQEYFIDMTSHELRNPMSSIVQCADAVIAGLNHIQELIFQNATHLSRDWNAEVANLITNNLDTAETIVSCAEHQKRIVNDILTVSKLDSKLLAITPVTVNPVTLVEEALKMFAVEARRMDIDLNLVVEQSFYDLRTPYLDFDPSRLKQVLINLLANALKFTKGGEHRNVSVAMSASTSRPTQATSKVRFIPRSQESSGVDMKETEIQERKDSVFIIFEVKDTGQGLTEDEQNNLFQRFVQASSSTHVKYGGSGLGLFISRRLTELQNGAIGVTSQPGVGSTFVFYIQAYLPSEEGKREAEAYAALTKTVGSNNETQIKVFDPHPTTPTGVLPPSPIASVTPVRKNRGSLNSTLQLHDVLLVEDNPVNQSVTRKGLESAGLNVRVANHGAECLDMLRFTDRWVLSSEDKSKGDITPRYPLSLILMDIEMPVIDGLTCTRRIRKLEREGKLLGGRIPIIAVSANARPEQISAAMDAGCDEVMVKPFRIPELIGKMSVLIESVTASGSHVVAGQAPNGDIQAVMPAPGGGEERKAGH